MKRKTLLRCAHVPMHRVERLPADVVRWVTRNNPQLDAVAIYWPEEVQSILTYPRDEGLSARILEWHFTRYVEPTLRERLYQAQAVGGVQ